MAQRLSGVGVIIWLAMITALPAHARTSKQNQKQQITKVDCFTDEERRGGRMKCAGATISTWTAVSSATRAAHRSRGNSVSLSGVAPPLASKAREIVTSCGSKIVSTIRVGSRVYGGSASNHASGRAVDLQGNPRCIYAHLRGWRGGYSTDYANAPGGPHVHVSWNPGGMEWGLKFRHGHNSRKR